MKEENSKDQYRAKIIENINNRRFQGNMSPEWHRFIELWLDIKDIKDIVEPMYKAKDLDTYIVFDIETTGLEYKTDKIIKIRSNKSTKQCYCR